jgi:homoserine kinase
VVPSSTSNLGAGFDALGLALAGFWLTVRAEPGGRGLRILELSGEGASKLPRDGSNRVLLAAAAAAQRAGVPLETLGAELRIHSDIPLARGLGSSAAAAVAGAYLADTLLEGKLGLDAVLEVAAALEGHPDNVAPALRGGMQVAVKTEDGKFLVCPVALRAPIRAVVFVPNQELSTERARAVLPREVPLKSAVFNLSRAALLVSALAEGRLELLGEAMRDALHQAPRSALMPWLPELIQAALTAGSAGASLSGAGTTVFAFVSPERSGAVAKAMQQAAARSQVPGLAHEVEIAREGARVERA